MTWVLVYWMTTAHGFTLNNHLEGFKTKQACLNALQEMKKEAPYMKGVCLSERVR